jgi:3-phosphoshikimate 1-carboxyvinyltransferase
MNDGGLIARPGGPLRGDVRAPGDKSISHRSLILGAMAQGVSEIEGLLESADVLHTAQAMRAFGADVVRNASGAWRIEGRGALTEPDDVIDCGNAGTGVRLIMGAAAGYSLAATFTGDQSLRGRPMMRVLTPLGQMGASWICRDGGRLPLTLRGGSLSAVQYRLPQPSAQVKSAVLLAGLNAAGETEVFETEHTRDHTERMLRAFGAEVHVVDLTSGRSIRLAGGQSLSGARVSVPGDPSSAAFPLVAALITPGSEVTVRDVLLNPLRTGLFDTLLEMGADLTFSNVRETGAERIGDVTARHGPLKGVIVPPDRAASMIDEYPILAVAAAFARGETVMRGIGELRVKESDRIAAMARALTDSGVEVEEEPEGMVVVGASNTNHGVRGGAAVRTHGDHRIAMSNLVLGLAAIEPVSVDEAEMIGTSFPGFHELMTGLGADLQGA